MSAWLGTMTSRLPIRRTSRMVPAPAWEMIRSAWVISGERVGAKEKFVICKCGNATAAAAGGGSADPCCSRSSVYPSCERVVRTGSLRQASISPGKGAVEPTVARAILCGDTGVIGVEWVGVRLVWRAEWNGLYTSPDSLIPNILKSP